MWQHNLRLAYRNIQRFKSTFFINLVGLSTGLACAVLIYLWVSDELSVDKFHQNDAQLYQVMYNLPEGDGRIATGGSTPGPLAQALANEMPEVERATTVIPASWFSPAGILSFKDKRIKAAGQFVGKEYLNLFSWRFVAGNPNQALKDKHGVAISDELARKLFNTTQDVVGKTVEWNQGTFSGPYTVAAIFEKPPHNSSAQFDLILSYDLFFDEYRENLLNWGNSNPETFILLKEGTDVDRFNAKIKDYVRSKFKSLYGTKDLEYIGTLFVQPYSDRYLYNNYENGRPSGGRIAYVELFALIALFVLTIACINFINLSTAKASTRLSEIGVKKALGADRKAILFQFLGESTLVTLIALGVALLLVALLLPQFNQITGKPLTLWSIYDSLGTIVGIALVTGLLSGSYPAVYLSGFQSVMILKGKLKTSIGEVWARKGLVVVQFTISVGLIVAVLVVNRQVSFIQTKHVGYERDNVIQFASEGRLTQNQQPFLNDVSKLPGVVKAATFNHTLTGSHGGTSGVNWPGKDPNLEVEFGALEVGYGLLELLAIRLVQGRSFSPAFGTDSAAVIFNEAATRAMGLQDPIGKSVQLWDKTYRIIGVAKDFHFDSFYEPIKPCFIRVLAQNRHILVKIKAGDQPATLSHIEQLYRGYNPGLPFEYTHLDQNFQAQYAAENRVAALTRYFAGIAILIAALGLFGLATFTAQQRTKEIGVRKVLGASEASIVRLLSVDFLKLVLTATVLASLLAWFGLHRWLQGFAYRVDIGWWAFALSGLLAVSIALLTVSFQSVKTARLDPVKSLRAD